MVRKGPSDISSLAGRNFVNGGGRAGTEGWRNTTGAAAAAFNPQTPGVLDAKCVGLTAVHFGNANFMLHRAKNLRYHSIGPATISRSATGE